MKKYVLVFFMISFFSACKERKVNQLPINKPDNITHSIIRSDQKLDIDGYYIPVNRFLIGQYKFESLLVNFEKQKLLVEINFIDTLSGEAFFKKIDENILNGDSLYMHMKDDKLGELLIKGFFLMSPVNNPKVKEKSTIVMKGNVCLNNRFFDIEFMYFSGD